MNNKRTNVIFAFITAILSVVIAVIFFVLGKYLFCAGFIVATCVFVVILVRNYCEIRYFVNPHNLLPLASLKHTKEEEKESKTQSKEAIRERVRKNLALNKYLLEEGYYVCRKNKECDFYFTTYTKDNVMDKLKNLSTRFDKDEAYITNMVRDCGFSHQNVDVSQLSQRLIGAMRYYDGKPELLSHKKKKYFIYLGIEDDNPNPKPMFTFCMFPYNTENSIDHLSFIDVSTKLGVARLETMSFNRHALLRNEIRKIFKGVLDFENTVALERAEEINKH